MQILNNISLKPYNTFGIVAQAAVFLVIEKPEDIPTALTEYGTPQFIVGGGSNMLIVSEYLAGPIWKLDIQGISESHEGDEIIITAGAGILRDNLVKYCAEKNYRGIENMVAIPGTVGAAPVQNIGAYGVELKDIFLSCTVFNLETQQFEILYTDDCHFGYRHSLFKEHPGKYIITDVTIKLSITPHPILTYAGLQELQAKIDITSLEIATTVEAIRRSKLPKTTILGNSGSFFQNPIVEKNIVEKLLETYPTMPHYALHSSHSDHLTKEKLSAARLIENAGLKGYKEGNVGTYEKQPLVIVNHGGATGQDIFQFSEKIIHTVQEKFNVTLVREVNIISE